MNGRMIIAASILLGLASAGCKEEQKQTAKAPAQNKNPNCLPNQYGNQYGTQNNYNQNTNGQYGTQQNTNNQYNNVNSPYSTTPTTTWSLQGTTTAQGQQVAYEGQVQQLLQQYCVSCHGQNDTRAPMYNYQTAFQRGQRIVATATGFSPTMPKPVSGSQVIPLSPQNQQLLLAWQQGGFLERLNTTGTSSGNYGTTSGTTNNYNNGQYGTNNQYGNGQYGSANQTGTSAPCY